jgi:hypothetical protein
VALDTTGAESAEPTAVDRDQIQRTDQAQKAATEGTPETRAAGNSGGLQERRSDGRFRKGASGNPAGRHPGSRNKATVILDALGGDEARTVLDVVVRRAKEGDMRAAEILLNRAWPAPKGRPVVLDLPPIDTPSDAATASAVVLTAVAEGRLTPSEAATMLGLLETHMQAVDLARARRETDALAKLFDL